jgi:WD40 repeat protein
MTACLRRPRQHRPCLEVVSGRQISIHSGHAAKITRVCFSTDRHFLLSIADDNIARLWSVGGSASLPIWTFRSDVPADHLTFGEFAPDGKTVAIAAGSGDSGGASLAQYANKHSDRRARMEDNNAGQRASCPFQSDWNIAAHIERRES